MTTIDRDIARAPMPKHQDDRVIAALLHRVAIALEQEGPKCESLLSLLAAQGWGTSTLGDGTARSTDGTSSTEGALGLRGKDDKAPKPGLLDRWSGKDRRRHKLLRVLEQAARAYESLHTDVMAHGTDDDPIPGGTGECACCGRFCRPDGSKEGRDEFRLKAGLCPACYRAYLRDGQPWPRGDWIRDRKRTLTDDQGIVHPEDDSGSPPSQAVGTVAS